MRALLLRACRFSNVRTADAQGEPLVSSFGDENVLD
jgi:hypothetical protein